MPGLTEPAFCVSSSTCQVSLFSSGFFSCLLLDWHLGPLLCSGDPTLSCSCPAMAWHHWLPFPASPSSPTRTWSWGGAGSEPQAPDAGGALDPWPG